MITHGLEIKNLFQKNWFAVFVLISLLFFQLIYSFLFPAVGSGDGWLPLETQGISSEYRFSSDALMYLNSAQNFSRENLIGSFTLARPLYSFLIFLVSLPAHLFAVPSFGTVFGLAILVNFILMAIAVLFFFEFLKNLFSLKVAWLSSVLLIFSPHVHNSLVQPLVEMLIVLAIVLTAYFLYSYIKKPSFLKLIIFSLIIGVFMLGKMFYAISFFILPLSIYFKRYKEGIIFLIVHLIPLGLWYLWVTQVWKISYSIYEIRDWEMGIWMFKVFSWPWSETAKIFLRAIPYFITALLYGFLFIPIIFSVIGWKRLPFRSKNLIYFSSIGSLLLLGFIINLYAYRHAFLLFPLIYPAAVLGVERIADFLKRFQPWFSPLFHVMAIGLIIFISNINFYQVFNFDYLTVAHWSVWPLPDFLENIFKTISGRY